MDLLKQMKGLDLETRFLMILGHELDKHGGNVRWPFLYLYEDVTPDQFEHAAGKLGFARQSVDWPAFFDDDDDEEYFMERSTSDGPIGIVFNYTRQFIGIGTAD